MAGQQIPNKKLFCVFWREMARGFAWLSLLVSCVFRFCVVLVLFSLIPLPSSGSSVVFIASRMVYSKSF